jgi:hypothetical protein
MFYDINKPNKQDFELRGPNLKLLRATFGPKVMQNNVFLIGPAGATRRRCRNSCSDRTYDSSSTSPTPTTSTTASTAAATTTTAPSAHYYNQYPARKDLFHTDTLKCNSRIKINWLW